MAPDVQRLIFTCWHLPNADDRVVAIVFLMPDGEDEVVRLDSGIIAARWLPMLQRACHLQASLQRPGGHGSHALQGLLRTLPRSISKQMLQKMSPGPGSISTSWRRDFGTGGVCRAGHRVRSASRQVIEAAAEFALLQGYAEIRSPHLFAALITDGSWLAGALGPAITFVLAATAPQHLGTWCRRNRSTRAGSPGYIRGLPCRRSSWTPFGRPERRPPHDFRS